MPPRWKMVPNALAGVWEGISGSPGRLEAGRAGPKRAGAKVGSTFIFWKDMLKSAPELWARPLFSFNQQGKEICLDR